MQHRKCIELEQATIAGFNAGRHSIVTTNNVIEELFHTVTITISMRVLLTGTIGTTIFGTRYVLTATTTMC